MNNKSITVSSRSILWLLVFAFVLVLLIILLNDIDNRKKFNQYKLLNDNIQNSEYIDRFSKQINSFSPTDTVLIEEIKQNLGLLEEDIKEIDYSEMYIKSTDRYYKITNRQNYRNTKLVTEIKYLPKNISSFIQYLEQNPDPDIDSLYSINSSNTDLELMIKVGNGYLRVSHQRN